MLAHAAARRGCRSSCLAFNQPWRRTCPVRARHSHTKSHNILIALDSRTECQILRSIRQDSRALATTQFVAPQSKPHLDSFVTTWSQHEGSSKLYQQEPLEPWHTNPLIVHDLLTSSPTIRLHYGMGTDPVEMHQNLYACLCVGRLDRATHILERLESIYVPLAPELLDAHNVYLQALFESLQDNPTESSMNEVESWFENRMIRKGIRPNAHTYTTLIRAAISYSEAASQYDAVRRYIAMALDHGPEIVEAINESAEFSDEEWDTLIRAQPEAFTDPPSVEEVHSLHTSSPEGRKDLVDLGLVSHPLQPIKPVIQKGVGLDSLKQALTMFNDTEPVPFPTDIEGTQEDKDSAYAYARQVRIEQDSMSAAVERWKVEDQKLQGIGVHGVMKSQPIQSLMYAWYVALVPVLKKQLREVDKVMSGPLTDRKDITARGYGPWLEQCKPETLAAITVARVVNACIDMRGEKASRSTLKVSALSLALGNDIREFLKSGARRRRDIFLDRQRKLTRKDLIGKLSKTVPDPSETTDARPAVTKLKSTEIPLTTRTKLGALCLELMLQTARLDVTVEDLKTGESLTQSMIAFAHQMGFENGKRLGFVVPHHEFTAKLRNDMVNGIQTVSLPMVCPPKQWSSFEDGGYYTVPGRVMRQKGVDLAQRAYAESAIENGDMNQVLAGLDVLGQVPWQINAPMLHIMTEVWNRGEGIGGFVAEDPGVVRPADLGPDATIKEKAAWAKEIKSYDDKRSGHHSQRCFQNFQLETARAYVNEKKMFFPHSIDFRGRAYPIPPILNHIGADVARGLLKFAHGKELGTVGLRWLKVHLANLYGFDKASLSEREKFTMDNLDEIRDSATDPLNGRRWWAKAEDPWQCLACCIELKNALDLADATKYVSQLPVHQDGTCNGLQHYAALGGDHAGARQVNLEPSDRPQDIYTGVAELVKEMVKRDAAEGSDIATFIEGHITRKMVKRTVMTNVYGVTFMGAKKQVHGELVNSFPNFQAKQSVKSLQYVALYIATKIFDALGKIFNGAQEIQYWLGECGERITTSIDAEQIIKIKERFDGADMQPYDSRFQPPKKVSKMIARKLNKNIECLKTSIIWTTPLKLPIVQPYRKDTVIQVKTGIQEISVKKRTGMDAVDKRKQLQAFPPNFIHSLDATHMLMSAIKCHEVGLDFAAVHDSFWTHASDIPKLNTILRDAFVRMHSEDIVGRLAAEFSTRYAGSMYQASIVPTSEVAHQINRWRAEHALKNRLAIKKGRSKATFEEVALEAKRQELLNSEDVEKQQEGKSMVTPTSIWLMYQDSKLLLSHRLNLIGETESQKPSQRQVKIKKKVLSGEAEAAKVVSNDAASKIESTLAVDETIDVEEASAEEGLAEEGLAAEGLAEEGLVEEGLAEEASAEEALEEEESAEEASTEEASIEEASADEQKKTIKQARQRVGQCTVWIPLTFPPVPKKGTWDVSRLRQSKYFFS